MLNLLDSVISGYPLLIIGLFETIAVAWVYGTGNLIRDIEMMIGKKPKYFWWIWIALWRVITPVTILVFV